MQSRTFPGTGGALAPRPGMPGRAGIPMPPRPGIGAAMAGGDRPPEVGAGAAPRPGGPPPPPADRRAIAFASSPIIPPPPPERGAAARGAEYGVEDDAGPPPPSPPVTAPAPRGTLLSTVSVFFSAAPPYGISTRGGKAGCGGGEAVSRWALVQIGALSLFLQEALNES